ncbi:MAG: DUF1255 family protein [Moraxellaceae bacterium]|nr:DUF1255 family protein [Moraxellaceae bacterium]
MSVTEFANVSVLTQANISYEGRCSSHTILFEDGGKKMLGVIAPNDEEITYYRFQAKSSQRMEILTGECQVKLNTEEEYSIYRAGQAFMVAGDTTFKLRTAEPVQYICHLEG